MTEELDRYLDDLPIGWGRDRLKDVAALRTTKVRIEDGAQDYLELEDIEGGTGRILNVRDTLEVASAVTIFQKGDVLFGKLRPYLEKYWLADFDGKCTGEILAIEPQRIQGPYLRYCVASRWFIEKCNTLAYGAKMPRVDWTTQLAQFVVPLPPIDEQSRITAFLDRSCKTIDEAIAAKCQQVAVLNAVLDSTIVRVTTCGLRDDALTKPSGLDWLKAVPAHWKVQQIKRRCELMRGKFSHRPRNDPALYDGDYPFVQTGDITAADKYIRNYSQTLNELGFSVSRMFPKGTLVMSIAANVGDVAILDFEACFPDSMVGLVPDHRTDLDFLFYLMRAMKSVLLRSAVLTTQLNLNYVRIGTNFAPFPPHDEQREIAQYLDEKTAEVRSVVDVLRQQIDVLSDYRKSLIHEYVTGQRRVPVEQEEKAVAYG